MSKSIHATSRSTSGTTHLVIPDTQLKADVPMEHMRWAGEFAAEYKPTHIIHIGDGADMESLSSFDVGKKSFEGRTYIRDVEAFKTGFSMLMKPIKRAMAKSKWQPTFTYTLGNHENRINRAIELDRKLDGLISIDDLQIKQFGWRVHDFLEVVEIDGVHYSHYFTSGVMGRPVASARALLNRKHASCVMGHVQKYEVATDHTASGKRITGLFASCYYLHKEAYRDPQSQAAEWHGLHFLSNVSGGQFDLVSMPIDRLEARYG